MATDRNRTIYYGATTGSDPFANFNSSSLYKPGELGTVVPDVSGNRRGQLVQLDSGCTAATATGIVAAGQVAFWKDKSQYLVTNDSTQANAVNGAASGEARNFVAGVFQLAVTAGNYTLVLQRSDAAAGFSVKATGSSWVSGDIAVANTGTAADVVRVAAGTAPTCVVVGTALGAAAGGKVPVWVNLPEFD